MKILLSRLLAPIRNPFMVALETLLIPAAMVALGLWLNPTDPFFVHAQFPWPWLAPLILALRYGPLPGLGGALLLFLGWYGLEGLRSDGPDMPKLYFLGGLIMVMLSGEVSSLWQARLRRAEATQDYLDKRLDGLTRTHYLLRLSHEDLERELLSRPVSMRDALTSLRDLVASLAPADGALPAAERLLKLAVQYCQIERAAIVPMHEAAPELAAATFLGAPFPLAWDDALIQHALGTGLLTHIASRAAEQRLESRYLVVAPITDLAGTRHALLIVETLPFLALQQETLQILNLILSYYADSLAAAALVAPIQAVWPGCPAAFALELQRLHHLQNDFGVPNALASLRFSPDKTPPDLPGRLCRQQRALDITWLVGRDEDHALALLAILPLATPASGEGYLARIERWLGSSYGTDWEGAGIRARLWEIGGDTPLGLLNTVMENCDVAGEAHSVRARA